jgi:hypothetical protein
MPLVADVEAVPDDDRVARRKWAELSPQTRRIIVVAGSVEGVLKLAALIDLARRPADEVAGSKVSWALAIALINSVGAVPILYFRYGRRKHAAT